MQVYVLRLLWRCSLKTDARKGSLLHPLIKKILIMLQFNMVPSIRHKTATKRKNKKAHLRDKVQVLILDQCLLAGAHEPGISYDQQLAWQIKMGNQNSAPFIFVISKQWVKSKFYIDLHGRIQCLWCFIFVPIICCCLRPSLSVQTWHVKICYRFENRSLF